MRRITTTKKINEAITNSLLQIQKAEVYNKTSGKTETIDADKFYENLQFLCESIFADTVGWHYTKDYKTGQYLAETGRMDGDTDIIFSVHLNVCDGTSRENVEKELNVIEEE